MENKDLNNLDHNMELIQKEYETFLNQKLNTRPEFESLKIIIKYLVIGVFWILFSDRIVSSIIESQKLQEEIQLYKGWFYVVVTSGIFYLIIMRVLKMYTSSIDKILLGYEELIGTHEELISMNEELKLHVEEHMKLQESLRAEKELSNHIIIDASSIVIVYDTKGTMIQYNPCAEKIFGRKKEEMIGQRREEFFLGIGECETKVMCGDGRYKAILWNNSALCDKDGNITGVVSVGTDITTRREMEEELERLAYYDTLTNLPNRAYLEKITEEEIASNKKFALVNMDLDNFKHINDTLGHSVGDDFIQYVANILCNATLAPDVVVRLSGDQFAFLVHVKDQKNLSDWLEHILGKIRSPWNMNGQKFMVTATFGVACYPEHGSDFSGLMQNSDIAMFYQKEHGKDGFAMYETDMFEKTLHNIMMSNQLKEAIDNKEFILYYQPQFDLVTGSLIGVEALVRWKHPLKGFIQPNDFIPFSEQTGQIIPISIWVLQEAIRQKREWESRGYQHIKMAINFSGHIFNDKTIFETMCILFEEMQIRPDEIEIEVTETAVMMELEKAKSFLHKLKGLGITIAMDDFGSGYSSLNYLQLLPFDILKIDKEFIKNVTNDKETYIYQMVVELAHKMGLRVVAEGIETREQKDFLVCNNCDIGQGYYFNKPMPADEIEKLLQS